MKSQQMILAAFVVLAGFLAFLTYRDIQRKKQSRAIQKTASVPGAPYIAPKPEKRLHPATAAPDDFDQRTTLSSVANLHQTPSSLLIEPRLGQNTTALKS